MRTFRTHSALLLLIILVSGGVLSPLAHYSWMAASHHFEPVDSASGHMTHGHQPADETVSTFHVSCDYDSLFGTHHATPSAETSALGPASCDELTSHIQEREPEHDTPFSLRPRGPPSA
ncbi:MAG: hypothetical protein EBR20_05345 [Bacteroidetes bacterium]|nr:hypothetical protein [Bacteroidota bacterium]